MDNRTVDERFWSKVDKAGPNGCWLWMGAPRKDGYGKFKVMYKTVMAHRWAWERCKGPIPAGKQLDHLCRVRLCVRPDHLEPVTHRTNILRGEGWAAINSRKTACPRGHAYDFLDSSGKRRCATCYAASRRRAGQSVS